MGLGNPGLNGTTGTLSWKSDKEVLQIPEKIEQIELLTYGDGAA